MAIRLVTLFLALTVSTACAADFRRALAAYQSGKFAVALAQFRELALDGDAQAQFNLGIMYREGQGHAADPRTAARWFSRAARSGHRQAQFELGLIYDHGIGVGRNDRRAVYWYRRGG